MMEDETTHEQKAFPVYYSRLLSPTAEWGVAGAGLASLGLHLVAAIASTPGAVPAALGLGGEHDAGEVEPLDAALLVVAADHLAEGDLLAQAVRGLVRVDGGLGR